VAFTFDQVFQTAQAIQLIPQGVDPHYYILDIKERDELTIGNFPFLNVPEVLISCQRMIGY
jgi:hypothetical protein